MEFSRQEYWSGLPFPSPGGSSRPRDQTHVSSISCSGRSVPSHQCHWGSPIYNTANTQPQRLSGVWRGPVLLKPHSASQSPGLKLRFPCSICGAWLVVSLRWGPVIFISINNRLQSDAKVTCLLISFEQKLCNKSNYSLNQTMQHKTLCSGSWNQFVGQTSNSTYESTLLTLLSGACVS